MAAVRDKSKEVDKPTCLYPICNKVKDKVNLKLHMAAFLGTHLLNDRNIAKSNRS